jgi:hypothetical protein
VQSCGVKGEEEGNREAQKGKKETPPAGSVDASQLIPHKASHTAL